METTLYNLHGQFEIRITTFLSYFGSESGPLLSESTKECWYWEGELVTRAEFAWRTREPALLARAAVRR